MTSNTDLNDKGVTPTRDQSLEELLPNSAETLAGAATEDDKAPPTTRSQPDVFISYRVRPDEPLARALKRLLETALDPTPNVFVSGLGGVRASHQGFREQIQSAAAQAKAFLGVITPQSKDREWILFEAGAAFGRQVPYIPVLFGIDFTEISSSIEGYHAYTHDDRDGIERALSELGSVISCELRPRFGTRYAAFLRAFRSHSSAQALASSDANSPLAKAIELSTSGQHELAKQAFESCIKESEDDEARCRAILAKHMFLPEGTDTLLSVLEQMEPELRGTATWAFWAAGEEQRPLEKHRLLSRVIKAPQDAIPQEWVVSALGQTLRFAHEPTASADAELQLLKILATDWSEARADAAHELLTAHPNLSQTFKLLCSALAIQGGHESLYRASLDIAKKLRWHDMSLYFASRAAEEGRGSAKNRLAIELETQKLTALAYQYYARASEEGVGVATVNIAHLLASSSNSAAALQVLQKEHSFDAADPGYPHGLRAQLERKLREEQSKLDSLLTQARASLGAMAVVAQSGLESRDTDPPVPKDANLVSAANETVKVELRSTEELAVEFLATKKVATLTKLFRFANIFASEENEDATFLAAHDGDVWRAVRIGGGEQHIVWYLDERGTPISPTMSSGAGPASTKPV